MNNDSEKSKNTAAIWAFWGTVVAALITAIVTLIVANKIPFFTASPTSNPENIQPIFNPEMPSGNNSQPSPVPPALGSILFEENFDNNNNLWATGKDDKSEVYIEEGKYHIIGGTWVGLSKSNTFEDFYLETKIKRLTDHIQSTDYGVFFRQTESINYLFVINPDQQSYALLRVYMPTDQYTDLIPFVYSPRISTGVEENKIGILCSGNTITMYINGYRVDSIQDNNSLTGNFGFVGGSEAHIAVDYVRVWALK